jgi:hypothetical protein
MSFGGAVASRGSYATSLRGSSAFGSASSGCGGSSHNNIEETVSSLIPSGGALRTLCVATSLGIAMQLENHNDENNNDNDCLGDDADNDDLESIGVTLD